MPTLEKCVIMTFSFDISMKMYTWFQKSKFLNTMSFLRRWCAKLNLGPSKQVIEELPKIRVSLQYTKKHFRIPVPNLTTSSKDLQFAETSYRSCKVQGLSHFLLCDLRQHRPSAVFCFSRILQRHQPIA